MTNCSCSTTALAAPDLPGIDIVSFDAAPVLGYEVPEFQIPNHGILNGTIDFCDVNITYTHTGEDDYPITIQAWLPTKDWNNRLAAVGGSGWSAGSGFGGLTQMAGVVRKGYASLTTNGGTDDPDDVASWALNSAGEIDEVAVKNWASVGLNDMSLIGKDLVKSFYGESPEYSYFTGCSQGGRHGYELAQKYPDAFDGIAAAAPGLRLPEIFTSTMFWSHLLMNQRGEYPSECQLSSVDASVTECCDPEDGLEDGVVSDPRVCTSVCDPFDYVGSPASLCGGDNTTITELAAFIVNATWTGAWDEKKNPLFFGLLPGTTLNPGVVITECDDDGENCVGVPPILGEQFIQVFGMQDPEFDTSTLTYDQYLSLYKDTKAEFDQYIGSVNPDMSAFKANGGKILTYHGLADELIPADIVADYYDQVKALDANVADFYRYFEVPTLSHCQGGAHPDTAFDALAAWVEKGDAPDELPVSVPDPSDEANARIVCAYPKTAVVDTDCAEAGKWPIQHCYSCED